MSKPVAVPLKGEKDLAEQIAHKNAISVSQAQELLRRYGNDLRKIEEAAKGYRSETSGS